MRLSKPFSMFVLSAALAACAGGTADPASEVAYADFNLELENGGFDTTDEAPEFGDPSVEALSGLEADPASDPRVDAAILDLGPESGLERTSIRIVWGQRHVTEGLAATDWSGSVSTTRGVLRVRRIIRFEGETDRVLPRTSPQVVAFQSQTRPHNDGLLLTLFAKKDASAADPGELRIQLGGQIDITIPHEKLAHLALSKKVDDLGNGVAIVAFRTSACARGGLHGGWKRVNAKGGYYSGVVTDGEGTELGRLSGLWGTRHNGTRRFFGIYMRDGKPSGVVRGTWRKLPGHPGVFFRGHWVGNSGEHMGVLWGLAATDDAPGAGHFMGGWAEPGCGDVTAAPAEMPAADADLCSEDGVCVSEPAMSCDGADCSAAE